MKFLLSVLFLLPLGAYAQVQNQLAAPGVEIQHPPQREPARPEPARPAPQRPAEPARPAQGHQPIHQPAPVHPGPGPAHHGPAPARNHPGPHGEWHPHPGWHAGWHYDHSWHPGWFHVGLTFPGFIWLGDVPSGYWQCTAFNQSMNAFSEMGPDQDQAAYGALYDCGGANYQAAGCYIPPGYCNPR